MTFAVTGTVLTAVSIGVAAKGQREQRKSQRAQNAVRGAQEARQRMEQVRQQRIAQAQIQQAAATAGTSESSSAQGGYSAVGAKTGGNIGFINGISNLQTTAQRAMEKSAQYQTTSQALGALGNMSFRAMNMMPTKAPASANAYQAGGYSPADNTQMSGVTYTNPLFNPAPKY